jgi:hypothetical protein
MSVRKFLARNEVEGRSRLRLLGVSADFGKLSFEPDGVNLELDEPMDIEKGKTYTVAIPHTVKVDKGVLLATIPTELRPLITNVFMCPTFSLGIHDDITVTFKAKESATISKVLKLHVLELNV